MSKFLVGADIEGFVQDKATAEIQSSIGILPGTKEKPFKIPNGFVHKDNILAEFGMKPADNYLDFLLNVKYALDDLNALLEKKGKQLALISSHEMKPEYLNHHAAHHFSCDPDMNVWELNQPPRVFNSGTFENLRTAGGHIHIGFPEEITMENQIRVVKACELYIGLPSVIMDKDTKRKKLYGAGGSFRNKPYGIEYRVPSNFWVKDDTLIKWIFKAAERAWHNRHDVEYMNDQQLEQLRTVIVNNDVKAAKAMCTEYGINYVKA